MIEAIQVTRDIVIILAGVIIAATVVIVGMALLKLVRKMEDFRLAAVDMVNGVANPIKGVALVLGRLTGRHGK